MVRKIPIKELSREEWLKKRKCGIGGSDAGAVCGMNPYISPMDVFQDKLSSEIDEGDTEAMRQGRDLEAYVAQRFTEATGLQVRRSHFMYQSEEYPFMLADVDRLVVGEDAGLECKTVSAYNEDKWKDGAAPAHYLIQCLHYMAVTGKRVWYLAAVILGRGFQYIRLEWDETMIQNLIAIEKNFWEQHVVPGIMPDPDGSLACDEAIARYFPRAFREQVFLPSSFNEDLQRREELTALMKRLEAEQRQIEQKIKLFLGEHESAENERYRVMWSNVDTIRIDSRRMKEEQPELYQKFTKSTRSRRFSVKAA